MKLKGLPLSILASILVGIIQMSLLIVIWAYIVAYSRHVFWLIDLGLVGPVLYATLFPLDLLVNVILCLPGAYAICKLRPKKLGLYTVLAVLPSFVWINRPLINGLDLTLSVPWYSYVPGLIMGLASFPLAVFIVYRLTTRSTRTPAKLAPVN